MMRKHIPESIREQYRRMRARLLSIGLRRCGTFDQPDDEVEASRDFSVIVAIHDSPQVTRRCLGSLEKYGVNAEVILVDDNSQLPETVALIDEYGQRNRWTVIRHSESMGHSRSCEAGAHVATRPCLCLLNSDTVVTPWSWSGIQRAFESDPEIAVAGPSTSWAFTEQLVPVAECCRHHWNDCQIWAFARKYVEAHQGSAPVDLPQISGFAFFIRHGVWESFDGFDENLPDYGNEFELCIRLSRAGWRLVWTAASYIHHFGKASYQETRDARSVVARGYIARKHGSGKPLADRRPVARVGPRT
ncbi:MAG: glycosyltransferase [Sedimentisphaerales bacterium]|nr:glycosyltransferase [Sedimentisphaerales bacterium]